MNPVRIKSAVTATLIFSLSMTLTAGPDEDRQQVERGRYLIATSGCNDCHTPGYPESGGKVPRSEWLTGNPVGFEGPWGTTYPSNLRIKMQGWTEQQWLEKARAPMRPPMPWFSLRDMKDDDLLAIYAFVRDMGPSGDATPAYVPPGQKVNTPYYEFMPKNLPVMQAANASR
ncbi:c-type cytochrome [Sedimenticola sp.]|uniref:c-type cytochrome n=1 Tax=Sedimenticola sp. TaxID=1940285 RepID=UPI002FF896BF